MMIIVWIILAMGGLIFLSEVGEGVKTYLSNKHPKAKEKENGAS